MVSLYSDRDRERVAPLSEQSSTESYRSPWRKDYARLVHSASFRRLQGKTQVFPGNESDFFRNRLSHSLEVAQIAKSIAIKLNATEPLFATHKLEPEIVEFAGLAHDLGHPPFGHNGEEALDECMQGHGGFEGNAQTLRIISRLEKKETIALTNGERVPFDENGRDLRCGLNLTFRSLASVLKYDDPIPERKGDRPKKDGAMKGYYREDIDLVRRVKAAVLGDEKYQGNFKTIECSIMDIADDIAYSTYDLEDVFKSGFLTPLDLFVLDPIIYENAVETINSRLEKYYGTASGVSKMTTADVREILLYIFYDVFEFGDDQKALLKNRKIEAEAKKMFFAAEAQELSRKLAHNGYYRTDFTSDLVSAFLDGIEVVAHPDYPQLHQARLEVSTFIMVEVLKNITYQAIIRAPALQVVEYRGRDIVSRIFNALIGDREGRLLPDDYRAIYRGCTEVERYRTVCDFIAGMTDRYAIEFYSRLFGAQGLTVHKPL
ncbi:dGTP triphosphohydrolase [Microvirga sp. 17 mud 1-3]|uniref:dGTP triphosphohydrolase n=1 Tax=Microvirga sp. 17 mud 1-3 TaxID=2082949 RepID=UPI000D6ADA94|nr:dNTP triphosphohydrolase [Microvirga sp. 17 mud 1-3]AWM88273.1 deoxyguanosinetriphosphate triphosphohydrolase [Microvirga sp. 17 mud 1-3]